MKSFNVIFFIIFLYSCETSNNQIEKKTSDIHISNSVDTLAQLIDLKSYRPKSTSWTVKKIGISNDRTPGPTDYNLEALMTFDDTTIYRLKTTYKLQSIPFHPRDITTFKFNWLPKNYIFIEDTTLDVTYRPLFFTLSPYLNGSFIINNNDILLSFYTQ